MSAPEGRYMRLESVVGGTAMEARSLMRHRRRRAVSGSWVVLYPGQPAIGDKIRIRLQPTRAKPSGGLHERWVAGIVVPADRRGDGRSVVSVSKAPVMRPKPPTVQEFQPPPRAPPALLQRNPRICEACEGPCRPGAGMCDRCRARGARVAGDGVALLPGGRARGRVLITPST